MNPYLTEDNQPTETLEYTLDYYGISLDEFKAMSDIQITAMVKRFSDVLNDGRTITPSFRKGDRGKRNNALPGGIRIGDGNTNLGYPDSGSFSRYFSLDSWWTEKIKQLPASVQKTFPFLIVPKASKSEKNKGCEELPLQQLEFSATFTGYYRCEVCGKWIDSTSSKALRTQRPKACCWCENPVYSQIKTQDKPSHNNHPTVKPLKLMSYLITLGSREGDVVLDPFMGSGTTALACQLLRRHYIGSEINKDYYDIAIKRIAQKGLI